MQLPVCFNVCVCIIRYQGCGEHKEAPGTLQAYKSTSTHRATVGKRTVSFEILSSVKMVCLQNRLLKRSTQFFI